MRGHLIIADISGYTQFLTESELEHANGIIGELLNAIVGAIQAPLEISRIEGDAVFMYGVMPEGMSGQTVLESVELLYCAFAGSLENMVLNTTCQCNACVNIKNLGLKIIMHCGEFASTSVGGRETLSGTDVVLVHRLAKNTIPEKTGIADYMIVTEQCVQDLGVENIVADWVEHTEEYDHVGVVKGYVSSLLDVWAFVRQQNENKVVPSSAWFETGAHSEAPPAVVWDHLVDPVKRTAWLGANDNTIVEDTRGRIGPGAEYHCAHGEDNDILVFTVLDMRAVDYITVVIPMGDGMALRYTDYVIPSGTGTRIVNCSAPIYMTETGEDAPAAVLAEMAEPLRSDYAEGLQRLAEMADEAAKTVGVS